MASRRYHSLLVREIGGKWGIHFGDYDRAVVEQERTDIVEGAEYSRKNTRIITTSDHQDMINEAVAQFNAEE